MGQAVAKITNSDIASSGAQIVQLNPNDGRARQMPRVEDAVATVDPQLPAILEMVSRAATVSGQRRDRADHMEERATAAEERVAVLTRQFAELEDRLRVAHEEADRERTRAEDLGRRSSELIKKTQAMLTDANDRREVAEWRARQAEESFATLKSAVEKGFADSV